MFSCISFSQNKLNFKPILTTNIKPSDVDPPTTAISYTPVYPGNGYMLLNFDDQSLHMAGNNLAHTIEVSPSQYAPNITNSIPAHSGQYCVNLTSIGSGTISWIWMRYSTYKLYQFTCWVYLTNNYTNGYINLIHTDFPSPTHAAQAYVQFQTDGHVHVINMQTLYSNDVGKYPLNTWFNATIIDLWNGQYRVYINSVDKGSYDDGGQVSNSFSCESDGVGMYVDDYQMNTPTSPASKNFVDSSTAFTLSTNDNDSDATTMFKAYDNTTGDEIQGWQSYSSPFTLGSSSNGTYSIVYDSNDDCGNESLKYENVYIDAINPITTLTYTPMYSHLGRDFVNLTTQFWISATDGNGSGLALTGYSVALNGTNIAGGAYTGPFTLGGIGGVTNGTIMIGYLSEDNVGRFESANYIDVYVDLAYPVSTIHYTPVYTSGAKSWVSRLTVFSITTTDGFGSGIASTHYKYTGHAWSTYTIPFTMSSAANGTCIISYYSLDNSGNNETVKTETVLVDTIAPITIIHYTPSFAPNYINSSTSFTLITTDSMGGTGIISTWYRINHNTWLPYISAFNLAGEGNGTVTIDYYSIDNAGNIESTKSIVVMNLQHHVDVTIRYFASIGGLGIDFGKVITYVNGTYTTSDFLSFYGSMMFDLLVTDVYNTTIYNHVYNASQTGPSLRVLLPIVFVTWINNYQFDILLIVNQSNILTNITLGSSGSNFMVEMALGIYSASVYRASNGILLETRTLTFASNGPGSISVSFGVAGNGNENDILTIDYLVLIIICVAIGAVIVDITIRRKSPEHSRQSKNEERSSIGQIAGHHTRG